MIQSMVELAKRATEIDVASTPNYRVFEMIANEFRKRNIPVYFASKIKINVTESFFQDDSGEHDQAQTFIQDFCSVFEKIYDLLITDFGEEDAKKMFPDFLAEVSVKYNY